MKVGLQVPYLTWEGGAPELGLKLGQIARTAEDSGFNSVWMMDHFFQIPMVGPAEADMLEVYTSLGFLAAHTSRVGIGAMVTGVTYRNPGVLVKQVTTLDVLSGGRAWLGIGAAWFEREHDGLGVAFPPLKERFERLEEALQIAHQMWNNDNNGAFEGKHFQLEETLNVPQSLQKPHPRILIGGSGERKTLRLVAKYADACNIFAHLGIDAVRHKISVLREHCEREGRDYDDIEKTVISPMNPGLNGENAGQLVELFGQMSEAGVQTIIGSVAQVDQLTPLEAIGRDVIPQVADL
ncbi:MAG TPA: LLM class F420-dependent oxidoreductase [Dehalococcoidia bacterium]|nr:LLM class F420-dependent oxidoreductase [Dehalococcoidia bacterium]